MSQFGEQGLHGVSRYEAREAFGLRATGVAGGQHLLTVKGVLRKTLLPTHLEDAPRFRLMLALVAVGSGHAAAPHRHRSEVQSQFPEHLLPLLLRKQRPGFFHAVPKKLVGLRSHPIFRFSGRKAFWMLEQEFLGEPHGKAQIRSVENFRVLVPVGQHHAGVNAHERHSGVGDFPQEVCVGFGGFAEGVQEALDVQGFAVGQERRKVHPEAKLVQHVVQVQHHRGFVEGGEGVERQHHALGLLVRRERLEVIRIGQRHPVSAQS